MEFLFAVGSAFWIGILTSISPCPLATNIVAVSFISKKVGNSKLVLLTGILYALGRVAAYIGLSVVVIQGVYAIPGLSSFLQNQMYTILGPLLIIIGMFMLGMISITAPSFPGIDRIQNGLKQMGIWGAFPLGIIFALSFCPVSAALYFGTLIPLATNYSSSLLIPSAYGLGTGIPVFIFAVLFSLGVGWIQKVFDGVSRFEYWVRIVVGAIFILVGIYLSLIYVLKL